MPVDSMNSSIVNKLDSPDLQYAQAETKTPHGIVNRNDLKNTFQDKFFEIVGFGLRYNEGRFDNSSYAKQQSYYITVDFFL